MNGESEVQKLRRSVVRDLTGMQISVIMGPIIHDVGVKELAPQGAEDVLDRLDKYGYKVSRV